MEQLSLSLADAMKIDNIRLDDFEYKIVEAVTGSGYEEKVATLALHDGIAHRAARPNMQKFPALIVETHDGQFVGFITFQRNHKENEFCFLQSAIWDEWRCQALYIHMVEIALDQNTDNYPSMVTCSPKSDLETEELFTKAGFETYLKKSGFAFMVKGGVIDGHEVSTFECARLKKLVQLTETNVWNSLKTEWLREKKQWNAKIDNAGEKYDVINPRWATREDCWMTGGGISMAVNGKNHNGGASVLDPFACEVCLTLFMPEFGKRVYNPFGGGVVGMQTHIREVTAETGFHPGLQVACDTAALALEGSDAAAKLGGQGDTATGMAGADGAGDSSFRDDRIGHLVGLLLVGIAGSGHFKLGFDQHLGMFGHGGIEIVGLLRLPLTGLTVLELGVHSGVN